MLDEAALAARGAVIGEVRIEAADLFDPGRPGENRWLFRTANRLHIRTREKVIRRLLLFRPGDPFIPERLRESERLLRRTGYLYDAEIQPIRYKDGRVDVLVRTRDVWTLQGGIGFGRAGGENKTRVGLQDKNFLGRGKSLTIRQTSNVDRTSLLYRYRDPNVFGSRIRLALHFSDNSDGRLKRFVLERPFFSLDTRRQAGLTAQSYDRVDSLYSQGSIRERFRHMQNFVEWKAGFSRGLLQGKTRRWSAGFRWLDDRFEPEEGMPFPPDLPDERKLAYPWIGYTFIQDGFIEQHDLDKIDRTEDLNMGRSFSARLGWSSPAFGAARDEALLQADYRAGFSPGSRRLLLLSAAGSGRLGDGGVRNGLVGGTVRFYARNFRRHLFFASVRADLARRLDPERQLLLGGDNGLRGYPLRYQEGNRRFLLTVEQRFYFPWEVLKLARLGAAVFADVGKAWFAGAAGSGDLGLLRDVGVGLRIASTRSSRGALVHVDLAFPLDGPGSIDSVQFLVTTHETF